MKKIYLLSGLGANSLVYERIKLEEYSINHLEWTIPKEDETIEQYAKSIADKIDDTTPVILIGLSFGGIMAQEVAKYINTEKIIIISSVKKRNELPFVFRLSSILNLHRLIPSSILKDKKWISRLMFGSSNKANIEIINKYFSVTDSVYMKWAINTVVNWKQKTYSKNILHIHGNKDSVFPSKNIENATFVKNGTHLMVIAKSSEVNRYIIDFLDSK